MKYSKCETKTCYLDSKEKRDKYQIWTILLPGWLEVLRITNNIFIDLNKKNFVFLIVAIILLGEFLNGSHHSTLNL